MNYRIENEPSNFCWISQEGGEGREREERGEGGGCGLERWDLGSHQMLGELQQTVLRWATHKQKRTAQTPVHPAEKQAGAWETARKVCRRQQDGTGRGQEQELKNSEECC